MKNKKSCACSLLFQAFVSLMAAVLVGREFSAVAAIAGPCQGSSSPMSVCLPAVVGENPPSPTEACCAIIRSTDIGCLCSIVTAYSNSMGVNIHASLLLPKKCKKVMPSDGYTCNGYQVPY